MHRVRRLITLLAAVCLTGAMTAQTYVDNLDGVSAVSTFEGYSGDLPAHGWTAINGAPRFFSSGNDVIISNSPYNVYGVQFITSANFVANATYTLSFRMGYVAGPASGNSLYAFQIGTWDGTNFSELKRKDASAAVPNNGNFGNAPEAGVTESMSYTTGTLAPSGLIAIRWAQTNYNAAGADFFGFDDVKLSYVSAVPEPATYAAIFGGLALVGTIWVRRRRTGPVAR